MALEVASKDTLEIGARGSVEGKLCIFVYRVTTSIITDAATLRLQRCRRRQRDDTTNYRNDGTDTMATVE